MCCIPPDGCLVAQHDDRIGGWQLCKYIDLEYSLECRREEF